MDTSPSHILAIELRTRMSSRRLHFRASDDETAVANVCELFNKTRELMVAHAGDAPFIKVVTLLVQSTLRPCIERWLGWLSPASQEAGAGGGAGRRFRDPHVRREFYAELRDLEQKLLGYAKAFDLLQLGLTKDGDGHTVEDWISGSEEINGILLKEMVNHEKTANLGEPFPLGMQPQVSVYQAFPAAVSPRAIEEMEFAFIAERRGVPAGEALPNGMGLALSGGGIKSATFSLGVVQVLAKRGILKQLDYLSTVSGGGYLGTFLSSYLGSPVATDKDDTQPNDKHTPEKRIKEALEPEPSGRESRAVRHLRNHSKYLLHGGVWGKLNIAGLLASGVFSNLLMILPIPMFAAIALALLGRCGFWESGAQKASAALQTVWWVGAVTVVLWLLLPVVQRISHRARLEGKSSRFRSVMEFSTLAAALVLAAGVALYFYPLLLHGYHMVGKWLTDHLHALALSEDLVTGLSALAPIVIGAGGFLIKNKKLQSIAMQLFILSGPLFYVCLLLFLTSRMGITREAGQWGISFVSLAAVALLLWSVFGVNINMLAPHRYYRSRLCECYLLQPGKPELNAWQKFIGKLWRGYDPANDSDLGTVQYLKLSATGESRVMPYHLINAFVNLPASNNRNLRGRKGDFFLFSRHVCGSPSTGYVKTAELETADPRLDLGSAMAISGAAANTNMGWRSMRNFRFLMTLLNVRLGYWVPNFRLWKKDAQGALRVKGGSVGSPYLLAEMGGRMQENMNFLNLSDGGHIENLGAYELLRRRCKFIICVDGGGNRDLNGGDLQRLERYASIDFGIEMKYDLSELRADEEGIARAQAVLVKILYPARILGSDKVSKIRKDIGWMIYLRPSITGAEPTYLLDHWRTNPLFPYESLVEQFFSEEQFEGYRCLGQKAAESLFQGLPKESAKPGVPELFQHIANRFLPDNDPAFQSDKDE